MSVSLSKIRSALRASLRTDSHAIDVVGENGNLVKVLLRPLFQPYEGNSIVKLTEDNTRTGIKDIYISDIDVDAVILKLDHFGVTCFNAGTYNKACDFVILTKQNQIPYAFFIDLKSDIPVVATCDNRVDCTVPSGREKAWQMIGGSALLDALLMHLHKVGLVNDHKFRKRFILITKHSTPGTNQMRPLQPPLQTAAMSAFPKCYFDEKLFLYYERNNGETISAGLFV